ncbi:exodeoxyribonuclease VII large subunit [Larsenimonas salina]|uniref:exodeoxyribonuclease VII large subunit n=1 Tax=Larsenimonas salina TaxID=1295565 RepID=UPI0020745E89|nr:exodeoxyribonuclease VII large subunit [Larsenimonas salina]MCM5705335.1 exodeoxyribonuclease VII large subunit [Larsenimonas salina]
MADLPESPNALSVHELNRSARLLLDRHFDLVWVEGEVSTVSRPASGHVYFTLKDERAQVRCALFRTKAMFVRTPLNQGDQVAVQARVSLFEPRGDYQLIVEAAKPAGEGALLAAFEALKARLLEEGVFANQRPLPYPPRHLGIVTSATGAALQDVLAVLRTRWPFMAVSVFPVPVQGGASAPAIVQALERAAREDSVDALLVTRGGGSLEDLWAFNDERLARAIFQSPIPVMSAVGHEVDTTLADFAADARAPTPSAAAEQLVPDAHVIKQQLAALARRLMRAMDHTLIQASQRLDRARLSLKHPGEKLAQHRTTLEQLERRLNYAIMQMLRQKRRDVALLEARLERQPPRKTVEQAAARLESLDRRLSEAMARQKDRHVRTLEGLAHRLHIVSPLATLSRGYAIAENADKEVIRRAKDTAPGEKITIRLAEGRVSAEIKRRFSR